MDKFIQMFIEQNPYITPDCPNCNRQLKIKSSKFFDSKIDSKIICPYCEKEIELSYIKKDFETVIRQLKKLSQ